MKHRLSSQNSALVHKTMCVKTDDVIMFAKTLASSFGKKNNTTEVIPSYRKKVSEPERLVDFMLGTMKVAY